MNKNKFIYLLPFLLIGCQGDPVSNKFFVIIYVIPLGIVAYLIGSVISSVANLGKSSEDGESGTIKKIIIGALAMFLIYNIFKGCS